MNPQEGARKQIEIYKKMTGSERLRIVFELWEMALEQVKMSERTLHPDLRSSGAAERG